MDLVGGLQSIRRATEKVSKVFVNLADRERNTGARERNKAGATVTLLRFREGIARNFMPGRLSEQRMARVSVVGFVICVVAVACGGAATTGRSRAPTRHVDMDEMRIVAERDAHGQYTFHSYDAEGLFRESFELSERGDCFHAVQGYDRLVREFEVSPYTSAALYNAGICLKKSDDPQHALEHFAQVVQMTPEPEEAKPALFEMAEVCVKTARWDDALARADTLLARTDLGSDERAEAMARRAQALLGKNDLDAAERVSREALSFGRTRNEATRVRDTSFLAIANFVLGEVFRLRAEAVAIPLGTVQEQHDVLEHRAQLMLQAQNAYLDTVRFEEPEWSVAAGYRIGSMYDSFWNAIMSSPVPPPRTPMNDANLAIYTDEYHKELARQIRPLMRRAVRYWELTLMIVGRNGVQGEWADRVRIDLDRARARLLASDDGQPATPNSTPSGVPPSGSATSVNEAPSDASTPTPATPPPASSSNDRAMGLPDAGVPALNAPLR